MNLHDLTSISDETGEPRLIIDDEKLLTWALQENLSPFEAQIRALSEGILPLRYLKNLGALTLAEQKKICQSRLLICGCGGLGGVSVNLLARLGIGHIRVVDGDVFAESNLNRQWLCDRRTISRSKALEAREFIQRVNPFCEVSVSASLLGEQNVQELLSDVDLALDALDNLPGRFLVARWARKLGVPFIHAAATGWWGQISTFLPDAVLDLSAIYGRRNSRDPAEEAAGVLAPAPAVIAALQTFEALRLLTGKPPAYVQKLLYFDGESGHIQVLPLE